MLDPVTAAFIYESKTWKNDKTKQNKPFKGSQIKKQFIKKANFGLCHFRQMRVCWNLGNVQITFLLSQKLLQLVVSVIYCGYAVGDLMPQVTSESVILISH